MMYKQSNESEWIITTIQFSISKEVSLLTRAVGCSKVLLDLTLKILEDSEKDQTLFSQLKDFNESTKSYLVLELLNQISISAKGRRFIIDVSYIRFKTFRHLNLSLKT